MSTPVCTCRTTHRRPRFDSGCWNVIVCPRYLAHSFTGSTSTLMLFIATSLLLFERWLLENLCLFRVDFQSYPLVDRFSKSLGNAALSLASFCMRLLVQTLLLILSWGAPRKFNWSTRGLMRSSYAMIPRPAPVLLCSSITCPEHATFLLSATHCLICISV